MVREANIKDLQTIVKFNYNLAVETESLTLNLERLTKGVQIILTNPTKGKYFVYEIDGKVVGQLLITYEWSDWRCGDFLWIQSVYVAKEYRNQGVFSALFQHVQNLALKSEQICGLRLYVEKNNIVAKRTYQKLGMKDAIYDLYEWVKH